MTTLCRSSYYVDVKTQQHPGDREVRCGLPAGHGGPSHVELDDDGAEVNSWPVDPYAEVARQSAENEDLHAEINERTVERDRLVSQLAEAREACKRLTAVLIAEAPRLDVPYTTSIGTPWSTYVKPALDRLRKALEPS